jgi:sec-independent protein translocase protein TatB
MFEVGWTELLVIGIVALIVVGPRDLPGMFRALGRFTAKARSLGREFQRAMEAAADEAGVKDVAKDLRAAADPKKMGLDALNDAAKRFEAWDPKRQPAKPAAVVAGSPAAAAPQPAAAAAPAPSEAAAQAPAETQPAEPPRGPATQKLAEDIAARSAARAAEARARKAAEQADPASESPKSETDPS